MPNPQISRLRTLGLMFCLLGGTLIVFGWMGTARVACVDCQMPYLLSGGAAGLGLIVIGVGLLVIAQIRAEGDKIADRLSAAVEPTPEPEDSASGTPPQEAAPSGEDATPDTDTPDATERRDTEPIPVGRHAGPDAAASDPDFELPTGKSTD
ncbi:MAG: hypothetical protein ACRDT4_06425 [Micromonosporaceae bacterium]